MRKLTLLLCALLAGISLAVAQTSISGTVLSAENDEPVIGASILVKGANASTITDTDGKFTIKIPAGASRTLLFPTSVWKNRRFLRVMVWSLN